MAGPKFREAHAPDAQRFHAKYDDQHRAQAGKGKTQDSLANAGPVAQTVRVMPARNPMPADMDMPEMGPQKSPSPADMGSPNKSPSPADTKAAPTTGAMGRKGK